MATIRAHAPLDIITPAPIGGTVTTATSDRLVLENQGYEYNFSGHGFAYAGNFVTGGTLTAYSTTFRGTLLGEATGFSIPAPVVADYVLDRNLAPIFRIVLSGNDEIFGSSYGDRLAGFDGNDRITGGLGHNFIDGGNGLDTAFYQGERSQFLISKNGSTWTVGTSDGIIQDQLVSVERISFSDGMVATDEAAAYAYRLYQAAFDREPDRAGLTFWVNEIDHGMGLNRVAAGFVDSDEFRELYGTRPTNAEFVDLLYENVLNRTADQGGYDFWLSEIARGMERSEVLTRFSDSPENRANVAGAIEDGVVLDLI